MLKVKKYTKENNRKKGQTVCLPFCMFLILLLVISLHACVQQGSFLLAACLLAASQHAARLPAERPSICLLATQHGCCNASCLPPSLPSARPNACLLATSLPAARPPSSLLATSLPAVRLPACLPQSPLPASHKDSFLHASPGRGLSLR